MPIISLNGIDINYRDEGKGEVLLLIHNLTSNIFGLDKNIAELSKYYRVIAADLRGHGYTTHEEDMANASSFYSFDNTSADNLSLLEKLGIEDFWLFGQAFWGANTALHLFERVPDRVKGIVISSAYMIHQTPGVEAWEILGKKGAENFERMNALAREKGMMAVYQDRIESGQFWGPKVLNNPEILAVFADAHRLTSSTAFLSFPELLIDRRERIAKKLRDVGVPLLILMGEDESADHRRSFIAEMRKDYPKTQALILPDCGHYPTIENPADFNHALMNFYAGVARYGYRTATSEEGLAA